MSQYIQAFNGTPFKNIIWRMLGVRVGSRVFDDGCGMTEKTFVSIGDDCTLNAGSIIQCHSQEDGAFKSDRITIGAGCTLGVGAWVHYGVTMGDGVVLAPDSFLMKGEEVTPYAEWGGNPASGDPRRATGDPGPPCPAPRGAGRRAGPAAGRCGPGSSGSFRPGAVGGGGPFPTGGGHRYGPCRQLELVCRGGVPAERAGAGRRTERADLDGAGITVAITALSNTAGANAPVAPVSEAVTSFRLADLAQLDRGLATGDSGPLVVTVQQHLRRLGYYPGDATAASTSRRVRRCGASRPQCASRGPTRNGRPGHRRGAGGGRGPARRWRSVHGR